MKWSFYKFKKISKRVLPLALILFCPFLISNPADLQEPKPINPPYEICKERRQQYTQDILNFNSRNLQKMEGEYCVDCNTRPDPHYKQVQKTLTEIKNNEDSIPKTCFLLSKLRGIDASPKARSYYYCGKLNPEDDLLSHIPKFKETLVHSPCINEDYVDMTSQAFEKMTNCFSLNKEEKEAAFQLFNHESGFLLNAKSGTAARCYGQLTMVAVNHILHQVKRKDPIFEKFKSTCPKMKYPSQFKKMLELSDQSVLKREGLTDEQNRKEQYRYSRHISCKVTQDSHSCLFYSLFYFKINLEKAKEHIEGTAESIQKRIDWRKHQETTKPGLADFRKKYPKLATPLKMNELILVEGTGTSVETGKKLEVQWIFTSDLPAYRTISRLKDHKLSIRRIPLFDKAKLANRIAQWSHNGGTSVASSLFPSYFDTFKRLIENPPKPKSAGSNAYYCYNNPRETFCKIRKHLFDSTRPLKFSEFETHFSRYLNHNYPTSEKLTREKRRQRRAEVSSFMRKIDYHFKTMKNKEDIAERLKSLSQKSNLHSFEGGDPYPFLKNLEDYCVFDEYSIL